MSSNQPEWQEPKFTCDQQSFSSSNVLIGKTQFSKSSKIPETHGFSLLSTLPIQLLLLSPLPSHVPGCPSRDVPWWLPTLDPSSFQIREVGTSENADMAKQKGQEAPKNHQLFTDEVFIISAQSYILPKQMHYLARPRCYSYRTRREETPEGEEAGRERGMLKGVWRYYNPRILQIQYSRIRHLLTQSMSKQSYLHEVFDRYVWHASPSGKNGGRTAGSLLLPWFHLTKEHGHLQKTTCVRETSSKLFQAQQRIQQAKLLQYLKIQFLNYSSRLAIISLPQSMPNSVALVYMAPLWIRARTEGDILTGLPLLYPLNMDISHASVQHKPLCNCTDSNKREGAVQTWTTAGKAAWMKKITIK